MKLSKNFLSKKTKFFKLLLTFCIISKSNNVSH